MSEQLRDRIFQELQKIRLIDPHTHIDPLSPASRNLADILGYHYYTELVHSAGVPRQHIERPELDGRQRVMLLLENIAEISNTVQYTWFVEIVREFLGFSGQEVTPADASLLWDLAERQMTADNWMETVWQRSNLEAVFLTNNFDDPLEGFDTSRFVPCLRTDDLVFRLGEPSTQERLQRVTDLAIHDVRSLRDAIGMLFSRFASKQARACAISLPPEFTPVPVSENRAETALVDVWRQGMAAADIQKRALSHFVFWTLVEYCREFHWPFDLMIGVNRRVYEGGVYQGQDLFDSRVSLIQYRELFNAFPQVVFPISVLASVTNQELVSYAWIFPNVVTHGHWWYSNIPTFIERDAAARLEAVPRNKQIAYYSDMYKLEFALPKFNMYKRILAKILAERFVVEQRWTEEQAVALGRQVLRTNVERVFGYPSSPVNS